MQKGWLRYCTDDMVDKRCTFRPDDCTFLTATGEYIGSSKADLCAEVIAELPSGLAPFPKSAILSVPDQVHDAAARKLIESIRWPSGPVCPHCDSDKIGCAPALAKPGREK